MITKILVGSFAAVLLGSAAARATTIDLTTVSSGTLNGGIFSLADNQPTGTGVYDPFLTIQNNVTEQGYNSGTNNNFDTKRVPVWNHEIQLSELNTQTLNGISYFTFNVDINEPNGNPKNLISLDSLKIWTSSTLQTSTSTDSKGLFNGSLGTLRYDSGKGNAVIINDWNHGSGQDDLSIFIPTSYFGGASANDYVYMYQYWGVEFNTEGGFEETRIGDGTKFTAVPEPSSLIPLMGVFSALGGMARWRRKPSVAAE